MFSFPTGILHSWRKNNKIKLKMEKRKNNERSGNIQRIISTLSIYISIQLYTINAIHTFHTRWFFFFCFLWVLEIIIPLALFDCPHTRCHLLCHSNFSENKTHITSRCDYSAIEIARNRWYIEIVVRVHCAYLQMPPYTLFTHTHISYDS